ncbi:MAG: histidine phosphatase family protein [Rhodospirillales bacterium]
MQDSALRRPPEAVFRHPFYFLRHGETTFNRDRRFQGQLDAPLSPLGIEQAEAAAQVLADLPIQRIVSSPLSRARRTADAVAAAAGLEVSHDDELMECHLGIHQGKPYEPWLIDYWKGNFAPEGGEDFWQFRARVVPALARNVAQGPDCLVVAHGGIWYAARSLYRFAPDLAQMPNALPLRVTPDGDRWHVEVLD